VNMTKPPIRLRPANMDDARLLWEWRNDPATRRWFLNSDEVPWEAHQKWLAATLDDNNQVIYIAENQDGEPIGQARFSVSGEEAEIHVSVGTARRGQGLGTTLIATACVRLVEERPQVERVVAKVLVTNAASTAAFRRAGFRRAKKVTVHGLRAHLLVLRSRREKA